MSFTNDFLLSVAKIALSCRNKLLMEDLIPANIDLTLKTILSYFPQTLLPPKVTFASSDKYIFQRILYSD